MPRRAREKSGSDIYHVMLRGINRQVIFEEKEDYLKLLSILYECKEVSGFELFAYCLMSNHIHLLLRTGAEPLELVMKRISVRYAYWYNLKYERAGHLFQDRYRSETVENEAQFIRVLRYIIQNPMNAGLETSPGTYLWSSYYDYFKTVQKPLTDIQFPLEIFGSRKELLDYLSVKNDDVEMDLRENPHRVTDEQALEILKEATGCKSIAEYQKLDRKQQKQYAGMLRKQHLSLGQIARLTGLPKTTIHRVEPSPVPQQKGKWNEEPSPVPQEFDE